MKNYYKILEIDKDASPEIIKVAYKLLVKKFHPDLKEGKEKKQAEEKIKAINEAYDILSDASKKAEYDKTLSNESISQEQYNSILYENENLKRELTYLKKIYNQSNSKKTYENIQYTNMYDSSETTKNNNNNSSISYIFRNIFGNLDESIKTIIAFGITFLIVYIIISIPFLRNILYSIFNNGYIFIIILIIIFYIYFFRNKNK